MSSVTRLLTRTVQATRMVATDPRIPLPLRSLLVFGALPIPGPLDEAILLLAAIPLALRYRSVMREAWLRAATDPAARR